MALDVAGGNPSQPSWVGNRSRGPGKTLLSDKLLRTTQLEVAKLRTSGKRVAAYSENKYKDAEKNDGDHTAFPPSAPVGATPLRTTKSGRRHSCLSSASGSDSEDHNYSKTRSKYKNTNQVKTKNQMTTMKSATLRTLTTPTRTKCTRTLRTATLPTISTRLP